MMKKIFQALHILILLTIDSILIEIVSFSVYNEHDRWPVLFILIPILFTGNLFAVKLILSKSYKVRLLPLIIYSFLDGGIAIWVAHQFEWWKLTVLIFLCLLTVYRGIKDAFGGIVPM